MNIDKVFENMDSEKVMVLARESVSMDELVGKMGLSFDGGEDVVMSVNPRVEWWFRAVEAGTAVRKAMEVKDLRRMLMARRSLIRALWEMGKVERNEEMDVEELMKGIEEVQDPMEVGGEMEMELEMV